MKSFPITSHSLQQHPLGAAAQTILQAALAAVEPSHAVLQVLIRQDNLLKVQGHVFDLNYFQRVFVFGAGKAGAPMAAAAAEVLGERLTGGMLIVKDGHLPAAGECPDRIQFVEAAHPIPDERGVQATLQMMNLFEATESNDLVIFLVSGGGSALLTAPTPPVTLANLQQLTATLLACGATIQEINTIRKHLDAVKGGGIARLVAPAALITLILSDVVDSPLEIIASGPTVPDPSTYMEALAVLEKYELGGHVPAVIERQLQRGAAGDLAETPKPGSPVFNSTLNCIIASNLQALQAAAYQAGELGFNTCVLNSHLQGEAREVGELLAVQAQHACTLMRAGDAPLCLLAGGETTVTLHGSGLGGRNQELALSLVAGLAGLPNVLAVCLATDGGDGPTNAAGAVVTEQTRARAQILGLEVPHFLDNNDAYHFFQPLGDLLLTGPTRTNVNDLVLICIQDNLEQPVEIE